ncbi:hypothetical protein HanHA300_Chr16g0595411 [Helianthus annuus]|nr:hypothetical protein HanHA300_Chr16g0595411 [Helianthus annuus]
MFNMVLTLGDVRLTPDADQARIQEPNTPLNEASAVVFVLFIKKKRKMDYVNTINYVLGCCRHV